MVDTVARRYLTLLAVHIIREKGFTGHPFDSALTSDLDKQTMWGFVNTEQNVSQDIPQAITRDLISDTDAHTDV